MCINITDLNDIATEFILSSELNSAEEIGLRQIFNAPHLCVSSASDQLYRQFKESAIIGAHHLSPDEWLEGANSVISYFLPFTDEVKIANSEKGLPHLKWVYGRIEGEQLNNKLCALLAETLRKSNHKAIIPVLDARFEIIDMRANWSERHAAFASGLGTFSLSKSMITKKGSAGRLGSLITDLFIPPTAREYSEIYQWCSMCGECIERCPAGAIDLENGKDHVACAKYLKEVTSVKFAPRYGCGKCQTGVMCQNCAPSVA